MRTFALGLPRIVRFGIVGASCLGVQLLILHGLERFLLPLLANAIGFTVSAQLNFVLSRYFTWYDSARGSIRLFIYSWTSFNANVVFAVLVNSTIFWAVHHVLGVASLIAATVATAISTSSTFLVNHYLVFRPKKGVTDEHGATPKLGILHASAQRGE